jgi:CheY-like chemotaxis protein
VEDDEIMRSLTRQQLVEQGYRVIEAADGRAALEGLASHQGRVDLLLTDVVMKGMSGPELVSRVSQSHPEVKVIYMSGYTGELIAEHEILKAGVTLLEKPFTRSALLKTIHTALG